MENLSHIKEFHVPSYGSDFNGNATIQTLLQFFQEVAWEHAEKLDLGFDKLFRQNIIWVLARQKVKILKSPKWRETIKIKTWAVGRDKLFWYRDFRILNQSDEELAKASSSWIILNYETRKPFIADESFSVKVDNVEPPFEKNLGKIKAFNNFKKEYEKEINYSDLDLNDHVNNVKYLEWILDSYNLEYFKVNKIDTVELNYLAEAKYGDNVNINSEKNNLEHLHSIVRENDSKELLRAKIIWNRN